LDAEHDTVDGSLDEVLSTTTKRKASMGQEGGRHSALEGEWTHLVGEGTHASDLVPNPRASGLIALHDFLLVISLFALQFRNHCYLTPISLVALEKILLVLFREDRKSL
jgi:hypothetical protein